jgi:hypothetical protein
MTKRGRPSRFKPLIAAALLERLADGESLRKVCGDPEMPARATVLRWLAQPEHSVFRDQYARAREVQADVLAEEIIDIADDRAADAIVMGEGGRVVVDHENVQRARLRVDARKWFCSKVAPKKYGDRLVPAIKDM